MKKWILAAAALSLLLTLCTRPTEMTGGSTITDNAKITGKAYYADGAPAKGASVRARAKNYVRLPGAEPDSILRRDTRVNDVGVYVVDSLRHGDYRIEINDQKADALLLSCSIPKALDSIVLPGDTLRPYTAISGTVDTSRLGVSPLFVLIIGLNRIAPVDTATGGFAISDLPPGNYTVRIVSTDTSVKPVVIDSVITDTGVTHVTIDTNAAQGTIDTSGIDTSGHGPVSAAWTRVDGPFIISFNSLCVNPQGVMFAGSQTSGTYYSMDRGATWSISLNGLTKSDITCLATSIKATDGTLQVYAGARSGGIYRAGSTAGWTSLTAGSTTIDNTGILSLAISEDGVLVFAGTAYNGILKSPDRGATWIFIDKGSGFPDSAVYCIGVFNDAGGPVTVLAGTPQKGVYRSIDTGKTWTNSIAGLQDAATECIMSGPDGKRVFAGNRKGIFTSIDKGVTWTQALSQAASGATVPSVALSASGPNVFAALYGTGIFRSADSGVTWTPINAGLPTRSIAALTIIGDKVFACPEHYGVYTCAINGPLWTIANEGFSYESIFQITSGGADLFVRSFTGIFRSTDNGASWTRIWDKLPTFGFSSFAVCPGTTNGSALFAPYNDLLYSSVNDGATWTIVNNLAPQYLVKTISVVGATIFAGFDFFSTTPGGSGLENSLIRSTDNGITWSMMNPATLIYYIYDMIAVPDKAGGQAIFMVNGDSQIRRSADNGENWTVVGNGLPEKNSASLWSLAVNVGIDGATILTGSVGKVYRSTDSGEHWTETSAGLPADFRVADLCVSPYGSGSAYIFASVIGASSLYLSTNNGDTWQAFDNGLPGIAPDNLGIHGNFLFSGGANGLWKTRIK